MSDVKTPSMLEAFATGEADLARLEYPQLNEEVKVSRIAISPNMTGFLAAEPGSVEEYSYARKLAVGYLVLTGAQLQRVNPEDQEFISQHFTVSSSEIYGKPEETESKKLIANQLGEFNGYLKESNDNPYAIRVVELLSTYDISDVESDESVSLLPENSEMVAEFIEDKFEEVLSIFDDIDLEREYSHEEIKELFQEGLNRLALSDLDWSDWKAITVKAAGMSTSSKKKIIKIGTNSAYKTERLKPLFVHEVLGHALMSVNGSKTGDNKLEYGVPGNLDVEEGKTMFLESVFSGEVPQRIFDRYLDTNLALGISDNVPLNRRQLHELHTNRLMARATAKGENPDFISVSKSAWNHVNRIYRGSLGTDVIGVNTKDIVYYDGYVKIRKYVSEQMKSGKSFEEVYNYVMAGCFDPTNQVHIDYYKSVVKKLS